MDKPEIVLYPPRNKRPVVVVNERGIVYDPPGLKIFRFNAVIPWSQIAAIYPDEYTKQQGGKTISNHYLAIIPRDVTAFLNATYPPIKREMVATTVSSFGGPMNIFQNFLPISVENLFAQINTQFRDKINAYNIRTEKEEKN